MPAASLRPILLALALFPALAGHARAQVAIQPALFERATAVETALPQSSVYAIVEDQRGFLWFATREGLGRWDGYAMRTWRRDPFDRASLPGNLVRKLFADTNGDLWALTERNDRSPTGIARLIGPDHERIVPYGHPEARAFLGPDGSAWLADSTHLWRFAAERLEFVRVRRRIGTGRASQGFVSQDGSLWVSTSEGVEHYPKGGDGRAVGGRARALSSERSWGVLADPLYSVFGPLAESADGRIWVAGVGLAYVDGDRLVSVRAPAPSIPGYGVGIGASHILVEGQALWISSLDGAFHYDTVREAWTRHSLQRPGEVQTQNWITGFLRDRAGTLWAGTVWGLHRARAAPSPFRLLAHDPDDPTSLGGGIVLSVTQDRFGALWIGTLGGGLNRLAPDGSVVRYRHDPVDPGTISHDWVWSLEASPDTLWVGTGGGLDAIALEMPGRVKRIPGSGPTATDWGSMAAGLHLDSAGTLWYGHDNQLHRRAPNGRVRSTAAPTPSGMQAIRPVPTGAWITTSEGLYFYDAAEDAFRGYRHIPGDSTSLPDDAAIALHVDRRGRVWAGTQSGLAMMEPGTNGFVRFSASDGLPSDVVYAIMEDDAGRLWMSTNRGLARYDEGASPVFRAYTLADGVGNVEFNRHAAFQAADGTMYFGGDRGVTVFHPDDLHDSPYQPPVVVTAMHLGRRDGTETRLYVGDDPIEVGAGVKSITFEFAALGFLQPERYRYAVRMNGWEGEWTEIGARRDASYANLPHGEYTFQVRAANEDGVWNDEITAVPLVILPAWWQTLWFRLLAALSAVLLVAGVVWDISRRRFRRELMRLEARRSLEAERARISRDMHDEVGASLSEIAILSEVARREGLGTTSGDGGFPNDRLVQIAETSRGTLDAIGEIIWAVNPTNDRLDRLVPYLREHAARYLDAANLHATLRFPKNANARPVSAEIRRGVFLIMKEALHNVIKHSRADAADVTLSIQPSEGKQLLTLIVADNGDGMTDAGRDRSSGGNGLANMRQRAEELGGTLDVRQADAGGTVVQLRLPLESLALDHSS